MDVVAVRRMRFTRPSVDSCSPRSFVLSAEVCDDQPKQERLERPPSSPKTSPTQCAPSPCTSSCPSTCYAQVLDRELRPERSTPAVTPPTSPFSPIQKVSYSYSLARSTSLRSESFLPKTFVINRTFPQPKNQKLNSFFRTNLRTKTSKPTT